MLFYGAPHKRRLGAATRCSRRENHNVRDSEGDFKEEPKSLTMCSYGSPHTRRLGRSILNMVDRCFYSRPLFATTYEELSRRTHELILWKVCLYIFFLKRLRE